VSGQNCNAAFSAVQQNGFEVTFFNLSSGDFSVATWTFEDGSTVTALNNTTHLFTTDGTHLVCLTIQDTNSGCQSTTCQNITIDPAGNFLDSTCTYTDCVFPGDANYDNIVNAYDVLPIALYNNTSGTPRPNASLNFVGQASADWLGMTTDSVNLKHVDCNGNGTINLADLAAVQQNFSFEHDGFEQKVPEGIPLWIEFDPIVYPTSPTDPLILSAGVMLGNVNNPVNHLIGLAFLLQYDPTLVVAGSVNVTYHNTSIIGQSNTAATLAIDEANLGLIAMANARTDQQFAAGHSRLATVDFTISDIVIGKQSQIKFDLAPFAIQGIDTLGYPIAIIGEEGSVVFNTTSTESINNYRNISLSPNPADDLILLNLGNIEGEFIEIFDNTGVRVKQQTLNQRGTVTVAVEDLHTGLYLVKVHTKDGVAVQRIFIR
jgi:PKD repeat protein